MKAAKAPQTTALTPIRFLLLDIFSSSGSFFLGSGSGGEPTGFKISVGLVVIQRLLYILFTGYPDVDSPTICRIFI